MPARSARAVAVEVVAQAGLVLVTGMLLAHLEGGAVRSEHALDVLAFAAGLAASILLSVGAWVGGDRRAARVAWAVGLYTAVALQMEAVDLDAERGAWPLAGSAAVLGAVGLLALAVRRQPGRSGDRAPALVVVSFVLIGVVAVAVLDVLRPDVVLPAGWVAAVDLIAWSGGAAVGITLLLGGIWTDRPLVRRVGLAFTVLAAGHAVRIGHDLPAWSAPAPAPGALQLAGMAMLFGAAVPFLLSAVRSVGIQQENSRSRLAEAEAVMASVAERDHEMRNLVAGLSGAASVLTTVQDAASTPDGKRLLVAAGAELERLQRMLAGESIETHDHSEVEVGPLLQGLAVVHRVGGLAVEVDIRDDPRAAMDPAALRQVVTNLLVNCARHAPGARVRLRAHRVGGQVRIEVADDGPGLPDGATTALLRRGVRGPGSTGSGLGLAISTELVHRYDGTVSLVSDAAGCTVVLDLPAADRTAPVVERVGV
ncbi:sensor histidine kinase [Pseudonocardia bannensis]|uniref:histidine kinase n=1 Tax=Pseudonocardia bannensis TaxID=630973 RepID=A0A848DJV3_9PSEU|nr:HAMP domain-containing sensor histidine kinase [Pseudonocardia bannensis]NMH92978.1 HAMP domain-containing histidine kinase [Pseudonocardia bannensis]